MMSPDPPGSEQLTRFDRRDTFLLIIVLAVAVATRCYRLGFASIWLDEAETLRISSLPLSVLWVTPYDNSPPLYYTVIHFLLGFGHSETLLRMPSVIFGVLTVAVIYLATRKIGGTMAAFAAALLLALSFHNIEYSQEARAYALLGLCLSISLLGLVELGLHRKDSSTGFTFREFLGCGGALYALGLLAALYTHNTTVFYWLGAQLFFFVWWIHSFRGSRSCILSWFVINLIVLFLWTPWLVASLIMIAKGSFSWLAQASADKAFATWRAIHGFRALDFAQPYADLLMALAAVGGIVRLRRNLALSTLFFSLLVLSSLATWAYGLVATPVFLLRTILWTSLISAILAGIGLSRLPKAPGVALLVIFLAGQARGVDEYFNINFAENESWRTLAAVFNEHQRPNDIVLIRQQYVAGAFFYYLEGNAADWDIYGWNCSRNTARSGTLAETGAGKMITWAPSDLGPDNPIPPKEGASLWVVEGHCRPENWTTTDAVFFPNWRLEKNL
jgi:hypothetical protein